MTSAAEDVELKNKSKEGISVEDVTIHVKAPTTHRTEDREAENKVVEDLLDPNSKLDFSVVPYLDDLQIARIIKELEPKDLPLIFKKFHAISNERSVKLRTNLSFRNISYKKGEDIYLSGVSGFVKRNTMTCVIGAPDSGITTLMKTIAGRASMDATVTGEVFLDGQPVDEGYSQHLGYIPKDDIHYPTLTVRETLRMSARMRVGEFDDIYNKLKVEIVMKFFGLDGNIASTIVGDDQIRGISGGQKRRVSVAAEIVAGHAIILADLLTNGLDSKTSYDLVKQMQTVAHIKSEINASMISLVQPAPELFELFDYLLLMSKGRSIFFGPVKYGGTYPVIDFLNSLGFHRPPGKSVPDFLAEISYNPVRFHVTRMSKQMLTALNLPASPGGMDTKEGGGADASSSAPINDKKEESESDGGVIAVRKLQKGKIINPMYFQDSSRDGPRKNVAVLRSALENAIEEGKVNVLMNKQSVVGERQSSVGLMGTDSVPGMRGDTLRVEETQAEARDVLKEEEEDRDYEEVAGIRLRRQRSEKSATGSVVVSTRDNEREVGFAYLLTSYKNSRLYYDLGHKLWTEFEPKMPWEKEGLKASRFSTSLAYQTFECLKREWIVRTRDRATLLGNLGERIFVALILGTVFLNLGDKQRHADARVGFIFIIILNFSMGASAQIPSIMMKKKVYYSQEIAGYYRGYAFFLAQQLISIPFIVCELFLFLIIAYGLAGLEGEVVAGKEFWNFYVVIFFCILLAQTWALFLCGIAPNTTVAVALFPVTVILKMLVCGYMIAPDDIPVYWKWLHTISFLTYAFRALMINEFYDLTLTCDSDELEPSDDVDNFNTPPPDGFNGQQQCPFTTGRQYLARYDMEDFTKSEIPQCILYLFCFFLVYHTLALISIVLLPHELGDQEEVPKFDIAEEGIDEHNEEKQGSSSYIEWANLDYEVVNRQKAEQRITLLNKVHGYARPGDMIALMGPSGAGKSTLLDVIAGKKSSGWITGERLINGKPMDKFFPRIAGYVEQFDTHVELATVWESVYFSAQLRLDVSDEEAREEAEHAMKSVRIWHVRDRLIGNLETGGISPELRKKTAIAVEIVARPTILFLDEPTTGLDSVSAMAVIDTVSDLTKRGLAVICTIHQPSAELFSRFQKILILQPTKTGGKVSYFGEVGRMLDYCGRNDLGKMSEGRNIADFALEALGSTHEDGRDPADVWLESKECKQIKAELDSGIFKSAGDVHVPEFDRPYARGVAKQFRVVLNRSYLSVIRDTDTVFAQLNSCIIIGLFVGSLYWDLGDGQTDAFNRVSLSFFIIVFVFYTAAYKIPLLVAARASSFREKTSNMYYAWILYVTEMLTDAVVFVPRAIILTILASLMFTHAHLFRFACDEI